MTELLWKLRVAVLWIFMAGALIMSLVVFLYEPETIKGIVRGELGGVDPASAQAQMYMALQPLGPLAMAFTTLALRDQRINRSVNGALALLAAVTSGFHVLQDLGDPSTFLIAVVFLVSLLLLWHVWKWPQQGRAPSAAHEHGALTR